MPVPRILYYIFGKEKMHIFIIFKININNYHSLLPRRMAFAECPRIMSRKKSTGSSEAEKTDSRSVRASPVGAFEAASGVTSTVLSTVKISTLSDLQAGWREIVLKEVSC